jgi:hypothetical protein
LDVAGFQCIRKTPTISAAQKLSNQFNADATDTAGTYPGRALIALCPCPWI